MSEAANEPAIRELIARTYAAMSSRRGRDGPILSRIPTSASRAQVRVRLSRGPEMAARMAEAVTRWGIAGHRRTVTVWVRGDFAWAQILGTVTVDHDGQPEVVPYWTTGVFGRERGEWSWRYWGGAEPEAEPRV